MLLDNNFLVIAAGGGGIPVIKDNEILKGVDAVVDKDLASEELAKELQADVLLILTDVENVFINYGLHSQEKIGLISNTALKSYYDQGQFPAGSMGPKVKAALDFLDHGGKKAIITSIENSLKSLLKESAGTIIHAD
jgi:carbamate kinase